MSSRITPSNFGEIGKILITGGGGYVGSCLVPKLVKAGYETRVLDLFMYGENVFPSVAGHLNLKAIRGDIRDVALLENAMDGVDAVIHLACISNDPSYELNPNLGKSINFDAFIPLVELSKKHHVKRFVYASSSSVYGVKDDPQVTEDLPLEPLTDYSKFKAKCEEVLLDRVKDEFTVLIARPSTVCGYAPRLRLDLTVNILTNHAVNRKQILVFGGDQKRPNIHIEDMARFYVESLRWPHEKIHRKIYNVGYENRSVREIAEMVREEIGPEIPIKTEPTDDHRSYHVCSQKIADELGFTSKHSVREAIRDLKNAFAEGLIPDSLNAPRYFNIKTMQAANLQ